MSELSAESNTTMDGRVILEPEYLNYIREHGYPVDDISDVRAIASDSRDMTHVVMRVETTTLPKGHPELDVVEDSVTVPVCSCEDFTYTQRADVSESGIHPQDSSTCKHIISAYREEKAKADDEQVTLLES